MAINLSAIFFFTQKKQNRHFHAIDARLRYALYNAHWRAIASDGHDRDIQRQSS